MNRRRRAFIAILVTLLIAVFVWSLVHLLSQPGKLTNRPAATKSGSGSATKGAVPPSANLFSEQLFTARFDEFLNELAAANDPDTSRRILSDLRKLLDTLPPEVASREVQAFLASAKDVATKLNVTIKPGGGLGDASSFRVFLLDYLGQIDRPAAGAVATQILSHYTTPDEWAVSLRNYAWANPDAAGKAYLEAKAHELLANPDWRKDPTAGFLEALDTIVYAHGTTLAPELATLARDKENRAAAHAAYLTLDRLTIAEPTAMLTQFVNQPELMQGREQTRANFVARADIQKPEERVLVEQYLLDPARSPQELATFAGVYPNANYMISDNLLTKVDTPGGRQLSANDRAALKIVEQWQNDPRFERLQPVLAQIHKRLANFVQQAGTANQ